MLKSLCKYTLPVAVFMTFCGCASVNNTDSGLNDSANYAGRYEKKFGFLEGYLKKDSDLPDASSILPAPAKNDEVAFFYDFTKYQEGKTLRNTKRGQEAVGDASWGVATLLTRFSKAFGMTISKEHTPQLFELISHASTDINNAAHVMKEKYKRYRPYRVFNEKTGYPETEAILFKEGSYPSGHAAFGYGVSLLLSEICPERKELIMKKGYEFGNSRVILGYHYQSDVDAGRLVAAMTVSRLHANAEFLKQMELAKAEHEKLEKASKISRKVR